MFCEQCGCPIAENVSFCTNCGNSINQPVKKKSKWPIIIAVIVLFAALICGMVFAINQFTSNDEKEIKERLITFETCYNEADIDGLTECFDEDTRDVINAAVGFSSELFGIDTSKILTMVLGFGSEISGYDSLNIEVENIFINSETSAIAETTFDFGKKEIEISLNFIKENNKWYISKLN